MLACEPSLPSLTKPVQGAVMVRAPGRLHLGFLDPAGTLGRPFGSLGLVIDGFETAIELQPLGAEARSDEISAETPQAAAELERVRQHLERLRERSGRATHVRLRLLQVLPAHAGFGSGTQLALAVGRAWALAQGLDIDSATLAGWLGRGLRSGIGIAGFDQGGLLLDGGPAADGRPAPLLSRVVLPQEWRVLVVLDHACQGLSGPGERQALASLAPFPRASAAEICHQVLMRVLPGAACADFAAFATGLSRVQQLLGEHFAPAQGGSAYTSADVGRVVGLLGEQASRHAGGSMGAGLGQSSWGPTGFLVLPSAAAAQTAERMAHEAGLLRPGLELRTVRPRARGATITLC